MDRGPWKMIPILLRDTRITYVHLAVFLALCDLWNKRGRENKVFISRRAVMYLAKIHSFTTYHKHIEQLQAMDYISYLPSYDPGMKSAIFFKLHHLG